MKRRGGRDDIGTQLGGELDCDRGRDPGRPGDQQPCARVDAQLPQCLQGGQAGYREGAGEQWAQVGWPGSDVASINQDLLGPKAAATRQRRLVHQHCVAHRYADDVLTDCRDGAAAFDAECGRRPQAHIPVAGLHQCIPRADAGSLNGEHHRAGTRTNRVWQREQLHGPAS